MSNWQPMDSAPRDGRWIIVEVECSGDFYEAMVGRWRPSRAYGVTYEWEVVGSGSADVDTGHVPPKNVFNHWVEDRICAWMPLPEPPSGA
jgi:hypothetical protein